jgi:hypothetical protein
MAAHRGNHVARDVAGIESVDASLGDGTQRRGELRVAEGGADRPRLAVGIEEIRARRGLVGEALVVADQLGEAR